MNSTCLPSTLLPSPSSLLTNGNSKSNSAQASVPISPNPITSSDLHSSPHRLNSSPISYEGRVRVLASASFEPVSSNEESPSRQREMLLDEPPRNLSLSVSVTSVKNGKQKFNGNDFDRKPENYLKESNTGNSYSDSLEQLQAICEKNNPSAVTLDQAGDSTSDASTSHPFTCHLCTYSSYFRDVFNDHVNSHYEFKCHKCDYMTKNEKEYRTHLKSEHDLTPEDIEDEQGVRVPRINSQGKVKTFKCKQCDFVSVTKEDFWQHGREHMKPDKIIQCPKCPFVTEFKHHMEYHVRNHFNSKPFKCSNCSYSCVNKSMLNSHLKSHTNIYQYRCLDCTYATKYCHSLKLHLRKYGHKPSVVLNSDGTPNPLPIIDVYGTRRGPKVKKDDSGNPIPPSSASAGPAPFPLLPPYILAQIQQSGLSNSSGITSSDSDLSQMSSNFFHKSMPSYPMLPNEAQGRDERKLKCNICDFETNIPDIFTNHMMLHEIKEGESPSPEASSSHADSEDIIKTERDADEHMSMSRSEHAESASSASPLDYLDFLKRRVAPLLGNQTPLNPSPADSDQEPASPPTSAASNLNSSGMLGRFYLERLIQQFKHAQTPEPETEEGLALDLSQEQDHEVATSVKPSNGSSSSSSKRSKRKGKAFRITRQDCEDSQEEDKPSVDDDSMSRTDDVPLSGNHVCLFCDLAFSCAVMYESHMSYHDSSNPLKCRACGEVSEDKVAFFLHLSRKAH